MNTQKLTSHQLAVTALMAAVMCILGPMSVPIGPIPITLTNLVVCFAAFLLGSKRGALSVVVYLALGAVGLPVFSGYAGGLAKLAGPTGGYLAGFVLLAFLGGLAAEKSGGKPVASALGLAAGMLVDYALGTAWFAFQMQCGIGYALSVCVMPFAVFDLLKIILAVALGTLLRRRLVQAKLLY